MIQETARHELTLTQIDGHTQRKLRENAEFSTLDTMVPLQQSPITKNPLSILYAGLAISVIFQSPAGTKTGMRRPLFADF